MRQCTWILALLSQEDPKTAGNAHNAYKITLNPSGFWNSQNSAGRKKKKTSLALHCQSVSLLLMFYVSL